MILYCKAVVEIYLNITASVKYRTVGKVFCCVSWTSWHVVWHPDFYNECESGFICSIHWTTYVLTHWGRVTHICVVKQTIIGSDNGLSPGRRQAIIRTNAGILSIGTFGTNLRNFKWNSCIFIQGNAFENVVWKMAAILSRPQCVKTHNYVQFVHNFTDMESWNRL